MGAHDFRLGFSHIDNGGNVIIPGNKLRIIINLDEYCLSLDGSNEIRGERLYIVFYDNNFSHIEKYATNSSTKAISIAGISAYEEALYPKF